VRWLFASAPAGKAERIGLFLKLEAGVVAFFIVVASLLSSLRVGAATDDQRAARHPAPVPFTVGARLEKLYFYPCADCHAYMDPDDNLRELDVEKGHPSKLEHGGGLIWCFSCHDSPDYGKLRNLLAEPIDFDSGYQVCGGCHSQKYLDWTHGAHGKRVANWHGDRRLYSCMECHNPHQPAILPRAPEPPPPIRAGLNPMAPGKADEVRRSRPEWEQINDR